MFNPQHPTEFEAIVTVFQEDEISYRSKETVPICVSPVEDD